MTIIYNYSRKLVNIKKALTIFLLSLLAASILGIARNGYKYTEDGIKTGNTTKLETKHFEYGLNPLEIIFNAEVKEIEYGGTYLTIFTNLIPRKIWPDKPDTGGLLFTKRYTNDQWGGYSNLATGIIVEGMLNFGPVLGVLFGIFQLLACLIYTVYI